MHHLPNLLTAFRIALVPVIVGLLWPDLVSPLYRTIAASLYVLGGLTDWADGAVARRYGWVTDLGKFLDPLSDKLFFLLPLLALSQLGQAPMWIAMAFITREFAVTGLRAIAANEGNVIAAGSSGKWKTAIGFVSVIGLIVSPILTSAPWLTTASLSCLYVSLVLAAWSGFLYFRQFALAR